MKKLLSVLSILFVLGTASVFSLGIGAQGGYTVGGHSDLALTLKVDELPCVFAIDLNSIDPLSLGVTADWWMANPTLAGNLNYFYGTGLAGFANGLGGDYLQIGIGGRLVAGLNVFLLTGHLELYFQGAWQPTFWIAASENTSNGGFVWRSFPINFGFRFWL